jgi:hypothetical protein
MTSNSLVRLPSHVLRFGEVTLPWLMGMAVMATFPLAAVAAEGETDDASGEHRFSCQLQDGQYTVMYNPVSQPDEYYAWAVPEDMGAAWPAERRCTTISDRLETYRPDGLLELQTGVENGYDIVCVTTEAVEQCRIVFTVPPGQDATLTRDRVFNNLLLADQGEQTEGVTTLTGGDSNILEQLGDILGTGSLGTSNRSNNNGINLQPFLDEADGGTGSQLRDDGAAPGQRLNPDNFR